MPVLTIIEDPSPPPAYQPVSLNDNDDEENATQDPTMNKDPNDPASGSAPVTNSLRKTSKLLRSNGGIKAYFRGFFCLMAQCMATGFLYSIFSAFVPYAFASIATLLASLALVQLSTVWVHIVITPENPLHFWRRLPPFKKTFNATAKPVALFFLASELSIQVPTFLGWAFGIPMPSVSPGNMTPPVEWQDNHLNIFLYGVIALSGFVLWVLAGLPALVILVRVQASLLAPDENTIVPFDRSFRGRVEPAVVGGKGYATMQDAWVTFGGWRRLAMLYVKIFAVNCTFAVIVVAVLVPEMMVMAMNVKGGDN